MSLGKFHIYIRPIQTFVVVDVVLFFDWEKTQTKCFQKEKKQLSKMILKINE